MWSAKETLTILALHSLQNDSPRKMEVEFQQREARANELATSMHVDGDPYVRLGMSRLVLRAAMSGLAGGENFDSERDQYSQTMTFGNETDEEGEEY